MCVKFVEYNREFFEKSSIWLKDPEIKRLTLTPDISEKEREEWFKRLPQKKDYYIRGIMCGTKPIGAVGIKKIDIINKVGEYWGYIGEKAYIGCGYGAIMILEMEKYARKIGLTKLYLRVADYNARAIKLYEKMGFINESMEIENGIKLLGMIKEL